MKKPTNVTNTSPDNNESWGSYNSETKQWSEKVYSGKAVREWILSTIQNIKLLLNDKLNKSEYNEDKVTLALIINEKADKINVGTQVVITYPNNFVIETNENAANARESLKNIKYEVRNNNGTKLFEFWAMALKYEEYHAPTYPNVWFISSNSPLTANNISLQIQNTNPQNSAYSYVNTFNTTDYYVVVEDSHSLTKVVNNSNFDYISLFNTTDVTISGYKVYHYNRVISVSVTWTFNIN